MLYTDFLNSLCSESSSSTQEWLQLYYANVSLSLSFINPYFQSSLPTNIKKYKITNSSQFDISIMQNQFIIFSHTFVLNIFFKSKRLFVGV